MRPFDDWFNSYRTPLDPYGIGNRKRGIRHPAYFDDLLDIAKRVLGEPSIVERVTAQRSLTVKVTQGNRQYRVTVEYITGDETPPVHMEIEDNEGNSVNLDDKHPDYTE